MSNPTPLPDLPPDLPAETPGVLPVGVPPPAYGWPPGAPPLAYSLPSSTVRTTRPRAVTTLGVLSICFALLGAAGSVVTAAAAFLFYAGAQGVSSAAMAQVAAAANAPPVVPATPTRLPPEVGPNGLAGPQRRGVVDAFYAVRRIRPPRLEQLDAILAGHGKVILLTPADRRAGIDPVADRVRGLVTDHGELYSSNPATAPDFFRLTTGRLEVYDDRAVFYPADGSATIRSAFGRPPGRRALTETEVAAVVARAKTLGRDVITTAQVSSLATALSSPDQKLIATSGGGRPGSTPAGQSEPQSVTPGAGGSVTVRFSEGQVHIGSLGELLPGPAGPPPPPKPSTAAFLVVIAASVASFALAVVLLIGAVLLLRGMPSARRLLSTWAWLKIPVTATAAVAFWWMASSFHEAVVLYGGATPARVAGTRGALMAQPWHPLAAGLLGLLFPMAVLILLRRRAVREYFSPTD